MKNVSNAMKGIVETQCQPTSTSLPFMNIQGYQHQQFIPVTSQAQHVWPEIVKCGLWCKLPLLPLLWHANAIDEN